MPDKILFDSEREAKEALVLSGRPDWSVFHVKREVETRNWVDVWCCAASVLEAQSIGICRFPEYLQIWFLDATKIESLSGEPLVAMIKHVRAAWERKDVESVRQAAVKYPELHALIQKLKDGDEDEVEDSQD